MERWRRWRTGAAIYFEPRVLAILFLGFSSGLPLALTGSTLQAWLTEEGVSLTSIGLFAAVGLPYTLKFLWAPLVDALPIPVLSARLGRRRAWLLVSQLLLMLSIVGLGATVPGRDPIPTALLAFLVAICSATQDIVIDAFRIESLEDSKQAAGMADYVAGYRVAILVSAAGALELASALQRTGDAGVPPWLATYAIMAGLMLIGVVTVLVSSEPSAGEAAAKAPFRTRFGAVVVEPFADFVRRPGWLLILLFVVFFKFGDALAGNMTAAFVLRGVGFEKTEYARVVKVFGFAAVLLGGFVGGYVYRVAGTVRSLWLAGLVQMISNLFFVWQARVGRELSALMLTIGVENLAGGLGSVIFVAYLSGLCRNRAYTATQYALLSALAAVGRTLLASSGGWLAEGLGWAAFFLLTTAAAFPGLGLLWWLTRRGAIVAPLQS
jgi:PAT family beta-lactamase induction signal transducer AmpG